MIQTFRSKKTRQYYFRVVARNNRIIAQSEGYKTKRSRDRGVEALTDVFVGGHQIVDVGSK